MEQCISGVLIAQDAPTTTTIIRPSPADLVDQTGEEHSDAEGLEFRWNWVIKKLKLPPARRTQVVPEVMTRVAPTCVHEFVKAVAKIPGVRCVVVEDAEGRAVHITSFVANLSDKIRESIYAIEGETILTNPNLTFDFHVRRAEEVSGSPAGISGKHYYAIWGDLDAK